jgi:hypothetical protein
VPPSFVLFLDRSLGNHHVAVALRASGAQVEIHDDHLSQDATDDEWLTLAGRHGWVVLTKDNRIRYRPLEKRSLLSAGLCAFILTPASMTGPEMASAFVAALPEMRRLVGSRPGPWIAGVSRNGSVRMIES